MNDVSLFDDLDRKFLNLSASMANVFSWTYGWLGGRLVAPIDPNKFDNASSKTAEIGVRAMILLAAFASFLFAGVYIFVGGAVLSAGAKTFRAVGYYFQKDGFTHVRGAAPEKVIADGHAKIMEWNIRGHGGGLHYAAGVVHWHSRLDRIIESILTEDADVIVLQEVYDASLIEALIERLSHQYAHFYTHLGANVWGNESGILVITKCAVHRFSHTDFNKTDEKVKRSFEMLEIKASSDLSVPCARIISTQLSPGKQASELRMSQLVQIVDTLAREKLSLPTLCIGSLNVNRDSIGEESSYLSNYLFHSYLDAEPTHSYELANQWAPVFEGQEESSDFISFFKRNPDGDCRTFPVTEKGIRLLDSRIVRGFDEYNTKTARSDHHAVVTEVSGLKVQ